MQRPAPMETVRTRSATADSCTASARYKTNAFLNNVKTVELKPSSSHCEYTAAFSQSEDNFTILSPSAVDPLYSNDQPEK